MSNGTYKNCKFLRSSECRKNPPTIRVRLPTKMDVMTSDEPQHIRHTAIWPTVHMHNWCGEYQPRENYQADPGKDTTLADAAIGLVELVYVGDGKVVCPPAFAPHIRTIVDALRPYGREPIGGPRRCGDCDRLHGNHALWCKAQEIE